MDKSLVVNMRKSTIRSIVFVGLTMLALIALAPNPIDANPYAAKPGEAMTTVQLWRYGRKPQGTRNLFWRALSVISLPLRRLFALA